MINAEQARKKVARYFQENEKTITAYMELVDSMIGAAADNGREILFFQLDGFLQKNRAIASFIADKLLKEYNFDIDFDEEHDDQIVILW